MDILWISLSSPDANTAKRIWVFFPFTRFSFRLPFSYTPSSSFWMRLERYLDETFICVDVAH